MQRRFDAQPVESSITMIFHPHSNPRPANTRPPYDQTGLYLRILTWTSSALATVILGCGLWDFPHGIGLVFIYGFPFAAPIAVFSALLFQPYLGRKALWFPPLALPLLAVMAAVIPPGTSLLVVFSAPCSFGLLVLFELIARCAWTSFNSQVSR